MKNRQASCGGGAEEEATACSMALFFFPALLPQSHGALY